MTLRVIDHIVEPSGRGAGPCSAPAAVAAGYRGARMVRSSCLCGEVAWEAEGPLSLMHHCHCARCRKFHGVGFATYLMAPAASVRFTRGQGGIARYESSPGFSRAFCGRCGAVVPGDPYEDRLFLPAGPLDDDPGLRPEAHIFAASKAPWVELRDGLPQFDAFPPGVVASVQPDLARPGAAAGGLAGSCLCGAVAYVGTGEPLRAWSCHCTRCRKARGAAHASNLFGPLAGIRFTRGEERLASYKVPEALRFMQVFCRTCGSPMPRLDPERDLAVIPMGSLDGDPGVRPSRHIFVASRAPWYEIPDDLPRHAEYPE